MPYEKISFDRLKDLKRRLEEKVYEKVSSLEVNAWVTREPVGYADRQSGEHVSVAPGDKWGNLWDCAWFHFKGVVPEQAAGQKVVLLIDINGELLLIVLADGGAYLRFPAFGCFCNPIRLHDEFTAQRNESGPGLQLSS